MKIKYYGLIIFLILKVSAFGNSFEGYISTTKDYNTINYPIWVDLKIDSNTGLVSGSYFYKKNGHELSLSGRYDGKDVMLVEEEQSSKKVTGNFNLELNNKRLIGTWIAGNSNDALQVTLHEANPKNKKWAKIPKVSELRLLEHFSYLSEQIDFYGGKVKKEDNDDEGIFINVLFSRNNILSLEFHWINYWYSARYGTVHHTFDLIKKQEFDLWEHFNSEFKNYILQKLKDVVQEKRNAFSDDVWIEDFGLENKVEVDSLFNVDHISERSELYLSNDSLYFWLEDYLEQNYSAGNRAATFDCHFGMPFDAIKKYLNPESILHGIFDDDQ